MPDVFVNCEDATAERLTAILQRSGTLPQGKIKAVHWSNNPAFNSSIRHLELDYSEDAPPDAPRKLLLKCNLKETWAQASGIKEAQFYQMVGQQPDHPPVVVRCYDAAWDETTGDSHVLLLDLSDTHEVPISREEQLHTKSNMPPVSSCEAVIDTLARFHGYWWNHALLGTGVAQRGEWCASRAAYEGYIQRRQDAWRHLREDKENKLNTEIIRLYERVFAHQETLWEVYLEPRLGDYRHLTLVHFDAYFVNFLCPRPETQGATYLIDWQSPEVNRASTDLVNLITTFWTPEQRSAGQREERLLRRYLVGLHHQGVTHYTWDHLRTDYRLSLIDWLLTPLQDRSDGAGTHYWWTKMQCLAGACRDWHTEELFVV